MWIAIFFYGYIGIMVLLGLKRYIPSLKRFFNNHPIGEWGMYSIPVNPYYYYSVKIGKQNKGFHQLADITNLSTRYLWHNFNNGQFISIANPDFPIRAFNEFPAFLVQQKEVQKIVNKLREKSSSIKNTGLIVKVFFSYKIEEKEFDKTAIAEFNA